MPTEKLITFVLLTCLFAVLSFWFVNQEGAPQLEAKVEVFENCPPPPTYLDSLAYDYEQHILHAMDKTKTPGVAVVIVKGDKIIYMKGFGTKATGTESPVDTNTIFRLASVSKGFAAILTGILVDEGILQWQDKAIDYLPDFALHSEEHTKSLHLKHILSHTTGLPYHTYSNLIEDGLPLDDMIKELRLVRTNTPPGKIYSYQNVAYSIVGKVAQTATDCSYPDLLQYKIFDPLGMKNASATYESIMAQDNVAQPHRRTKYGYKTIAIAPYYYNACPAGGINASVADMGQWLIALLGNKHEIISRKNLSQVFTPQVSTAQKWRYKRNWPQIRSTFYGLGWRIFDYGEDEIIYHGGYANGYRSEIAINRREKIGICVLANGTGDLINKSIPSFLDLYTCHTLDK